MIVYKIINLINGKMYIGKDKVNDSEYFGSGLLISRAIKKYGKENFEKIIIEYCNDKNHLNEREDYWIQFYDAQQSDQYYNITSGGVGGDYLTHHPNREEIIKKFSGKNNGMSKLRENPYTFNDKQLKKMTFKGKDNYMFNKKHKPESIQKQKDKAKGRFSLQWFIERNGELEGTKRWKERNNKLSRDRIGEKNSFYGKTFEYEKHPRYIDIPKDVLKRLIKEGLDGVKLAKHFNTTTTTIYKKVNRYWNCKMSKLVF